MGVGVGVDAGVGDGLGARIGVEVGAGQGDRPRRLMGCCVRVDAGQDWLAEAGFAEAGNRKGHAAVAIDGVRPGDVSAVESGPRGREGNLLVAVDRIQIADDERTTVIVDPKIEIVGDFSVSPQPGQGDCFGDSLEDAEGDPAEFHRVGHAPGLHVAGEGGSHCAVAAQDAKTVGIAILLGGFGRVQKDRLGLDG